MEAHKVDAFMLANAKNFSTARVLVLGGMLARVDDSKWAMLQTIPFKDPTMTLIISLFAGSLGIDRFYIGDMGLGVLKLLTCGGFGIWSIIDWFLIMDATRDKNFEKIQPLLL